VSKNQTDATPSVFVQRSVAEALSGFWVTIIPRWHWYKPSLRTIPIYAVRATAVLGLAVKEHVIVPESVPLAPDVMVNQSPPCHTDAVQEIFV
jgi:hypothetical protein